MRDKRRTCIRCGITKQVRDISAARIEGGYRLGSAVVPLCRDCTEVVAATVLEESETP